MTALLLFISNLPSIAAVAGATFLAYHEKAGWGWLIVTAILLASWISTRKEKSE